MTLFGRVVEVDIDTLEVRGLDVRFKVAANDQPEPNKAEIVIYNLNQAHREQLEQKDDVEVSLKVGYSEQPGSKSRIFRGDLREVFSVLDPPDWVTTLRTGDGDKQIKETRVSKSYKPGVGFRTAWEDVVKALVDAGVGAGNAIKKFQSGSFKDNITEFLHGGNVSGQAFKELQRLAKGANLDVSIQGKELVVTEVDKPLDTKEIVLSPSTGLISSPRRGAKGELKVRSLLIPDLQPKRKVEVQSRLISGVFVIKEAVFSGDTSGSDFYADLTCKAA